MNPSSVADVRLQSQFAGASPEFGIRQEARINLRHFPFMLWLSAARSLCI